MSYHFLRAMRLANEHPKKSIQSIQEESMIAISLAVVFLFAVAQQSVPQQSDPALQQRLADAQQAREETRQAAIHVNDLAGRIHSEADARAFVDAVADRFTGSQLQSWVTRSIRHRVAHAEYEAVSDPSRLISEQRVADIWNEYVRELDAPGETLVTVAELHNLRDAAYTMNKFMWKKERFPQSLWTMPDVYAVDAEGKVAIGCRAVEALKLLHDMSFSFQSVLSARDRVQKGTLVSDLIKQRDKNSTPRPQAVRGELKAIRDANPVRIAEYHYVQAHGQADYQRLLERLFAELFPAE
jgi:hypothetical protein